MNTMVRGAVSAHYGEVLCPRSYLVRRTCPHCAHIIKKCSQVCFQLYICCDSHFGFETSICHTILSASCYTFGWCCFSSRLFGGAAFPSLLVVVLFGVLILWVVVLPPLRALGWCFFFLWEPASPKRVGGRQYDQQEEEAKLLHPKGGRGKPYH